MHWQRPPSGIAPLDDCLHLWRFSWPTLLPRMDRLYGILDKSEQEKANRYYFEKDKHAFTVGRAATRLLLAYYLKLSPADIEFEENRFGKPFLKSRSLQFNVSHSGNMVLLGFHARYAVGVDVEKFRKDVRYKDIAYRFFSQNEIKALFNLPEASWQAAFFRCWSLKEAYIKACGMGLSMPLGDFDVELTKDEVSGLAGIRGKAVSHDQYVLKPLSVAPGYAAAAALNSGTMECTQWDGNYLERTNAWIA